MQPKAKGNISPYPEEINRDPNRSTKIFAISRGDTNPSRIQAALCCPILGIWHNFQVRASPPGPNPSVPGMPTLFLPWNASLPSPLHPPTPPDTCISLNQLVQSYLARPGSATGRPNQLLAPASRWCKCALQHVGNTPGLAPVTCFVSIENILCDCTPVLSKDLSCSQILYVQLRSKDC